MRDETQMDEGKHEQDYEQRMMARLLILWKRIMDRNWKRENRGSGEKVDG